MRKEELDRQEALEKENSEESNDKIEKGLFQSILDEDRDKVKNLKNSVAEIEKKGVTEDTDGTDDASDSEDEEKPDPKKLVKK